MPPTTQGLIEVLNNIDLDWAFLAPVIIDELSKDQASLDVVVSRLQYLFYTGGSVPELSGDAVASRIPLHQVMGSSECATLPLLHTKDGHNTQDWNYIQIHPFVQPEFRYRFDDLYELVILRKPQSEDHQPVFLHFPDLDEYETRDLFSPHPTKPGLWAHRGRIDDIVVFLNGEKTNPVSFEQDISKHPKVRSALVAGQHRFEPSLLVELIDNKPLSAAEREQFVERLWPTIQKANGQCPAYAKVSKSKILLLDPSLPMPRAGKGTVQRQATLDLYSKKLDELYIEAEMNTSNIRAQRPDLNSQESVARTIRQFVAGVTEWNKFENEDEFFSLGMDSLQVLRLRQEINNAFELPNFTTGTVYAHPSVNLLVQEILRSSSNDHKSANSDKDRLDTIATTLEKYQHDIDHLANGISRTSVPKNNPCLNSQVIVLTGSTGNIGSYILQELLRNKSVSHVYCLNRAKGSEAVQRVRNTERRLPKDLPSARVSFVTANLSKPDLGLDEEVYNSIRSTVTQIIHNAWPVDFNRTLQSFESSLDGIVNLIRLAVVADSSASIFFLSSISSVANYHNTTDPQPLIPESVITDLSCPAPMGYGESKYLAERILDYAARKLNLNTGAARIGQIAGTAHDPHGWNRNEWFPSLVLSSKYIGALPESLGSYGSITDEIDWVPVDQLAEILVELAFTLYQDGGSSSLEVFNTTHPHPSRWENFLPAVQRTLRKPSASHPETMTTDIQTLPFPVWVEFLRAKSLALADNGTSGMDLDIVTKNPGMKLLDFYESLLLKNQEKTRRMDIKQAVQASDKLRTLESVKVECVVGWVEDWIM
jgi:thioester reductase-like protein